MCPFFKRTSIILNLHSTLLTDEYSQCVNFLAMVLGIDFGFVGRPRVAKFSLVLWGGKFDEFVHLRRHFVMEGELSRLCTYLNLW